MFQEEKLFPLLRNDVSFVPPDISPTGTAVMNGPVYIGKTSASPGYEAILNVSVNKWVGTNELKGENVVRLLKNKTVSKNIEID